jgi:hypothetical protein
MRMRGASVAMETKASLVDELRAIRARWVRIVERRGGYGVTRR